MQTLFSQQLEKYADLIVRVGLNLQPDQKLMITGSGDMIAVAPLVQAVTQQAYKAGARFVDVLWAYDPLTKLRLQYAPEDSFGEAPQWRNSALMEYGEQNSAYLGIIARDPSLFADDNPAHMTEMRQAAMKATKSFADLQRSGKMNWCGVAGVVPGWAEQVFPDLSSEAAVDKLWQTIFKVCRLDQPDPVAAWETHIGRIMARRAYLTDKQYQTLHFRGPGTDLRVGLVANHLWLGGRGVTSTGIAHTPNLPTEETFTMPHRDRVDGIVRASKPLSVMGSMVEEFTMSFENGVVQNVSAWRGETLLRNLTQTDEGAARLGEVALVPDSSPISQSGILFYNTLFDENAASHVAIGSAYAQSMSGGSDMSKDEMVAKGGNDSLIHVDFMIGSAEIDVDGIGEDGSAEAVMRNGEWAFDV